MSFALLTTLAFAGSPWADRFELVDALGWAGDEKEVRRWLREARASDGVWSQSVRPGFRTGRARHRPLVAVEAELMESNGRRLVHLREAVVYTHRARVGIDTLTFRVFGNGEHGMPASARVLDLRVDGQTVHHDLDGSLLTVELPEQLRRGDRARVWIELVEELQPFDPQRDLDGLDQVTAEDVGSLGYTPDVVHLGGFLPLLSPIDEEGLFDRRPLPINGEYAVFDPINVHAVLDLPPGYGVATTGVMLHDEEAAGRHTVVAVAADVRDFVVSMGRDVDVQTFDVDGLRVRILAPADEALMARHLARWSRRSVEVLVDTYGPLSFAELDVVEGPLRIALGQEFPQLVVVDLHHKEGSYTRHTDHLWTVAHEIAHQWFSMEVGSDARDAPWVDEALATHAASLVVEDMMGRRVVEERHRVDVLEPMAELGPEGVVRADLPGEAYNIFQYSTVVYGRASLFVDAVRQELGPERFSVAMQRYVDTHRHGMAGAFELVEAFREAAKSPETIDALFLRYIVGEGFTAPPPVAN